MIDQYVYGGAAAALTALGITLPLAPFIGGMVVAIGCCFAVMAVRPLEKRRAPALTLLMGALAAVIAAMLNQVTADVWIWGRLPVQAQMGIAGALSQAVFEFVAARGKHALDDMANRVGLPGAEGE